MFRGMRFPLVLVLLAVTAASVLAVSLSSGEAQAPPAAAGESRSQANAREEAEVLTGAGSDAPALSATALANNFQDRLVTSEAAGATGLAFLPDDRLLVTDRSGRVRLHKPGQTGTSLALDISDSVCSNSERGLLGIAVDPEFGTAGNNFVYLYYTYKKFGDCPSKAPAQNNPVNRVARFQMNGDTIIPDNKPSGPGDVLVNNIPSPNGNHNAGDLHFGNDGKLYVSVGDGACDYAEPTKCQPQNDAARDKNVLLGKILRINPDGTIPNDNPYANADNGVRCGELTNTNAAGGSVAGDGTICKETYAWGFRNPFRFAIDPDTTNGVGLRANDVGGARVEEVSQVRSGGDYGWNCREGTLPLNTNPPCPGDGMVGPINQYSHGTGCSSVTGGAFVPNSAGWPRSYDDAYLFADYVCNRIFTLQPNGDGGFTRTTFANNLAGGGPVSLAFGPDGSLYYTTYAGGGQVRRVVFTNNQAPVAGINATPSDPATGKTFGPAPLTVNFDGSATDAEADALRFEWDYDYKDETFTVDATGQGQKAHTYDQAGVYTAALRVKDDRGNQDLVTRKVYAGNTAAPQPVIQSPTAGRTFTVGEEVRLSGTATDAGADGDPNPSLTWEVIRHHTAPNTHTHPYKTGAGAENSFTAPAPEDVLSLNPAGNYVEVRLTATDSQGLSKTVSLDVRPKTTEVRLGTRPYGLYLNAEGTPLKAPRTLQAWQGMSLDLYAPPQSRDGRRYVFRAWSDNRGNPHTVAVTAEPKVYNAVFRQR